MPVAPVSLDSNSLKNSSPLSNSMKVESYLREKIPEIQSYAKYIYDKSNGKAYLTVECDGRSGNVNDIVINDNLSDKYYLVYVGEQWEYHKVNWEWFFVSEDFNEILWYYLSECEIYTLSEWRNSSHYRQLDI